MNSDVVASIFTIFILLRNLQNKQLFSGGNNVRNAGTITEKWSFSLAAISTDNQYILIIVSLFPSGSNFNRLNSMLTDHSFGTYVNFPKRTCAYQGVRNVSFLEHFSYVLNEWSYETSYFDMSIRRNMDNWTRVYKLQIATFFILGCIKTCAEDL